MTTQPAPLLPYDITETTLDNGLRVIVVPTGLPHIVSVQIPVQTGSRNEVEPGKSGFAHFFEHMMFRGTPSNPPERYQQIIAKAGARQNAYTTDDYTNYHATFAKEDLETVLRLEADRFMNLEYAEGDFMTESRAVLGEYNKSASNPLTKLIEVQRDHAFQVHTYKHTTMGFIADIEDMPNQFEYSKVFFDRWYRPEHAAVIVAGDVVADEVFELLSKLWSKWEQGTFSVDIPTEPPPTGPVTAHVPWPVETLPLVSVAFHAPALSETDPDHAALDMLLDLNFGQTSVLYKRLVEDEQKVDQLFAMYPSRKDPALATVLARLKDAGDAPAVRDAILQTFERSRVEPVNAERLEDAKSHNRNAFLRGLDNSDSIAGTMAQFVHFRRSSETLSNLFGQYDVLTPKIVRDAGKKYLTANALVQTTLSHGNLPPEVGALAYPAGDSDAALKTSIDVPIIVQQAPSPIVRIKLQFGSGSAHDCDGKEGIAALAASMIADAGSESATIDSINRKLFPFAGSMSGLVDREMTTFTITAPAAHLDECLALMLPQLTRPGFRDEDFSRLKARHQTALAQDLRTNNEEELGREALQSLIFEGTSYGHPTAGTVMGLAAIELDDVEAFVAEHYVAAGLTIGIAGDVSEGLEDRLQAMAAALGAGQPAERASVAGTRQKGLTVSIIDKQARSTPISLGHPIEVTRGHRDFAALWLARAWLGEHRASHGQLFQRIREIRGINYGTYAYIEAFPGAMYQFFPHANTARSAQVFEIWVRPVLPENAVFTLKVALHELRALIEGGLTVDEFAETRDYLLKNVFLMTSTQDQRLGYALDSRWHGIGDFTEHMREQLQALTAKEVNAAMKRHLSADDLTVVMIAGNAEELRGQLLSDDPAVISYDAAKPGDLLEEDAVIGSENLGLGESDITVTNVDDVFGS
jgi:zinc protease